MFVSKISATSQPPTHIHNHLMQRCTMMILRRPIAGAIQSWTRRSITTLSTSHPPSSSPHSVNANANPTLKDIELLDEWIHTEKKLVISDTLRPEHLENLYITLPTRDGTLRPMVPPKAGVPLGSGHHLVFFHPRNPEGALRADGTDADFCPPEPWTRRMWAGGKFQWIRPLIIGDSVIATSKILSVDKKGFEKGSPMVFVRQGIEYARESNGEICIKEERSHVYLAAPGNKRGIREGG